ncbi:MAG: hypothetical protein HRT52_20255 [Colwellia sp.]|nr:hypothetical protein [Colwellia sp.]
MNKPILLLICLLAVNNFAYASEQQIKNIMRDHISGLNAKNLEAVGATLHSLSPGYGPFTQMLRNSFQQFDINVAMSDFDYMGKSGNYIVAKITMKYRREGGATFQDNETTYLYVFNKQTNSWKIWNFFQLEAKSI